MKNKKFVFFAVMATLIYAAIAIASPNGILPRDRNLAPVQGLRASGATPATSRCDTVTGTKAVFKAYTAYGYLHHELAVVDSTGAPVNVKWYQDSKQTWVGSTFSGANDLGTDYRTISFAPYSAAPRALTSCTRRK
ncbi:hypothetical protein L4X63_09285 [Geomonas sp. Red32]|uniref:hypothetical protein n=1 Tax=Geomonas sp. Red32 TaxID=2912856 RepID=UPI00202CE25B|nr:hypothetical protein [Geomonas sp. Red32]MCM0081781.1 hypothetical protein [Geomonas sp. Red32]